MLSFAGQQIFLVLGSTDMRKSFSGLSGLTSAGPGKAKSCQWDRGTVQRDLECQE